MGQPLSIENEEWVCLITTRTSGSRLWLVNNKKLEEAILGVLARYQDEKTLVQGNFYLGL